MAPRAIVFGCAGTALSDAERAFFQDCDPLGFILFARNIDTPEQTKTLVSALRETVSRPDAPVLIDQEGGRVQRLGPPHWPDRPPMAVFGTHFNNDPDEAAACAQNNARLIAEDLRELGIDVDCAPVLDLPVTGAHDIIGDRAFSGDPGVTGVLGRAVCAGLAAGGVMPVIKHIPGHGRATADSHLELPHVDTPLDVLDASDFAPFLALRDTPAAMTAHIVYDAIDPIRPASASPIVIDDIIRTRIGFDGLLLSDDVCMKALSGTPAENVRAVLTAGCDIALHCDGDLSAMRIIAEDTPELTPDAQTRISRARAACVPAGAFDRAAAEARLAAYLDRPNP